jgi:thiamine-monophosphate kinase
MQRMKNKSENDLVALIERAFGTARPKALRVPAGDDAAVWTPTRGYEMALTCDWFLEGTHFLRNKHPADAAGWKCLARAVSDIAAMGGKPRCFLLSLALPATLTGRWFGEFLRGLRRASEALHCELAGGDMTRHDKVLINVTVIGEQRRGHAILRSGAVPGDEIYVSGTIGEAELGLRELRRMRGMAGPTSAALGKHLYPQPRLALGEWLAENRLPTAMMDLSDGLSTDLPRLCLASGVGAIVESDSLPVSSLASGEDGRNLALHGGDDYELLFTVARRNARRLPKRFQGLRLTRIGEITRKRKILVKNAEKKTVPLSSGGWDPFGPS